jgi:hypothetical protein
MTRLLRTSNHLLSATAFLPVIVATRALSRPLLEIKAIIITTYIKQNVMWLAGWLTVA